MSTGIFLLQKDKSLIEMNQEEYVTENVFQELLENYPNLLAGDQIDELNPRKWLLVSREIAVPDTEASNGRWSVDHLFLDQDGIPTLVEVKRSSDTRIRREVVGQLLEYAANAMNYWSVDSIRRNYEHRCEKNSLDADKLIKDVLGSIEIEDFWARVKSNLEKGKLRLLFVADEIPFELKTLVEFLNEQMNNIEVLAIEIKQFVGGGNKTLVPRVIGQTSRAQIIKSGKKESRQWDENSFMQDIENKFGQGSSLIAQKLLHWAKENYSDIWWGKGAGNGSFFPMFNINGIKLYTFACWTKGGIELQFQWIKNQSLCSDVEYRKKILARLNEIPGVNIPIEKIEFRPSISYDVLNTEKAFGMFMKIWDDYLIDCKTYKS